MRKSLRRAVVLAAILAVAAIAAAACGDDGGSSDDVREVRVRASDDLRFQPSEIRLTVGERVRLVMENMGTAVHDFTVDEMPMMDGGSSGPSHDMAGGMSMGTNDYAMHLAVESHRDGMMEFTPTERGTYTYYCSAGGHRDGGMQGKMMVE